MESLIEKPDIQIKTIDEFSLEQEKVSQTFKYPIRRHDQIAELSPAEQSRLQEIYTKELNLPRHDLFDLYFAQVYHAQTIGFTGIRNLWERTISLGETTFDIVYEWKWEGIPSILYENQEADKRIIRDGRHFITWFINTYVREHRDDILFTAKHELPITLITEGPKGVGISLIMLAGGTVRDGIKAYGFSKGDEKILLSIVSVVVTLLIIFLCGGGSWILIQQTQSTPTLQTPITTLTASPTVQVTYTYTPIPPTLTPSTDTPMPPTPIPSPTVTIILNPNYCKYVTQPGDTAQSISSWFDVSETVFRQDNNSHPGTEFTERQMVKISAPCCNSQYPNWSSYTVQKGDNISSLASRYGIADETLAHANHLQAPWYIQTGQMLCVP